MIQSFSMKRLYMTTKQHDIKNKNYKIMLYNPLTYMFLQLATYSASQFSANLSTSVSFSKFCPILRSKIFLTTKNSWSK